MMNRPEWIQELRQKASACVEIWYTADSWPINEIFIEAASPNRILELLSLLDSQQSKLEEMEKALAQVNKLAFDLAKEFEGQLDAEQKSHKITLEREAATTARYDAKLEEMEEQKEAAYRSREGWRRCALDAEARVRELESQIEAAKVEGFNEGVARAANAAAYFSVKPEASIHPDIPWNRMNENAKIVAHTTAQQISWEISTLKRVADSKRGEE